MRRTSVLRRKTLVQGGFTSPCTGKIKGLSPNLFGGKTGADSYRSGKELSCREGQVLRKQQINRAESRQALRFSCEKDTEIMEEQLEQSKQRLHFCMAVIGGWFGAYAILRFHHFASAVTVNFEPDRCS